MLSKNIFNIGLRNTFVGRLPYTSTILTTGKRYNFTLDGIKQTSISTKSISSSPTLVSTTSTTLFNINTNYNKYINKYQFNNNNNYNNDHQQKRGYYNTSYSSYASSSPNLVIGLIIGANLVVFGMWTLNTTSPWQRFMYQNFTITPTNVTQRPYTMLTAAFSHKDPMHLLFNMLSFYFIGADLIRTMGTSRFLALYFGGALLSSAIYTYMEHKEASKRRNSHYFYQQLARYGLGASGAVSACMTTFACIYPNTTFMLYGIVPTPAWLLCVGYIGLDMYQEYRSKGNSGVAHTAHLGGAAFGGLFYFGYLRRILWR